MKTKAQTEIMGLVMIVILISIILLFVIKFVVNSEPNTIKQDVFNQKLASNTLNVLLSTTTSCSRATVSELLKDCAEYGGYASGGNIFCEGINSCYFVNVLIGDLLDKTIKEQGMDYEFLFDEANINIMAASCPGNVKQATANIPLRYGTKEIKLRICDAKEGSVNAGTPCTPQTCSQLGKTCNSWSDTCGGILDCGTCLDPRVCNNNGHCVNPSCVPMIWTPDVSTICSGALFTQTSNCGTTRTSTGTKTCPTTPDCDNDGVCDTGENTANCPADCFTIGAGDYDYSLAFGVDTGTYKVHVPSSYIMQPISLIINLHGGGGDADNQKYQSDMNSKSDLAGFIVVYPNALKPGAWNVGNRENPSRGSTKDDIGFLRAMISDLKTKFNIDGEKIYATGLSDGGMMAYKVACEMSDVVSAVAPVATNEMPSSVWPCNPTEPVSIMHFHGTADPLILYTGGTGTSPLISHDNFPSVETTIDTWKTRNNCNAGPNTIFSNGNAQCIRYSNCDGGSEVDLCTIIGGGHTWPDGAYYPDVAWYRNMVGDLSTDISANDEMWTFFQAHIRS